ncbi:hypothetical protein RI367_001594 [Sorochytrium milnesiophthora]
MSTPQEQRTFQLLCRQSPYLFLRKDMLGVYFKRVTGKPLSMPVAAAMAATDLGRFETLRHDAPVPQLLYYAWKMDELRARKPTDFALRVRFLVLPSTYSLDLMLQMYELAYQESIDMHTFRRMLSDLPLIEVKSDGKVAISQHAWTTSRWPDWVDGLDITYKSNSRAMDDNDTHSLSRSSSPSPQRKRQRVASPSLRRPSIADRLNGSSVSYTIDTRRYDDDDDDYISIDSSDGNESDQSRIDTREDYMATDDLGRASGAQGEDPYPHISTQKVDQTPFEIVRNLRKRRHAEGGARDNGEKRKVIVLHRDWTALRQRLAGRPVTVETLADARTYETTEVL